MTLEMMSYGATIHDILAWAGASEEDMEAEE